jgi:hypothetical protein
VSTRRTKRAFAFLFAAVVVIFSYPMAKYLAMPWNRGFAAPALETEPEPPRRPGILGIEIDLPMEKAVEFTINPLASEPFGWQELEAVDPSADVRVYGTINANGALINIVVKDVGHATAGRFIRDHVHNWTYLPLKQGDIQFHFNMPSEGEKLIVYSGGLRRNESLSPEIPIKDGKLHAVEGLDPTLVRIVR